MRLPRVFEDSAVVAGFSTRHGGVSAAPFGSLNVGLSTGDDADAVKANREILFRSVGLDPERLAVAGQVHGAVVSWVDRPGLYRGVDALVTDSEGLVLAITAADCAVVLLADQERGLVGAVHSGWRGTVAGIVSKAIREMTRRGAEIDRLSAYVSACISVDSFEVGEEVATQFADTFVSRRDSWGRPHVDLRAAIHRQITDSGIHPSRVEVSQECTYDHPDFFSYRAESGATGRMMGFIAISG